MSKTPFILTLLIAAAIIGCTKKQLKIKLHPALPLLPYRRAIIFANDHKPIRQHLVYILQM